LDVTLKFCSKCKIEKDISDFPKARAIKSGYASACKACDSLKTKAYYAANREKVTDRVLKNRALFPEKRIALANDYYERNKERLAPIRKAWQDNNREKCRAYGAKHYKANPEQSKARTDKRRATVKGRLENRIRAGVHRQISSGSKRDRKIFDILGYTSTDLMKHLESKFLPGMSWETYSITTWHIDHIRPLASFNYTTPDCPDFKDAWSLKNLQPLWALDNLTKGSKWIPANDNIKQETIAA
jgi:hypothetical protein